MSPLTGNGKGRNLESHYLLQDVFYPKHNGMISDDGYFHLIYKKTTKSVRYRDCNKTGLSLKL